MVVNPGKQAPSENDLGIWRTALGALATLSEPTQKRLQARLKVRELDRGEYLLRAGQRATCVAWVTQGLLREHYVLPDGTERTKAFVEPGGVTGSAADLLSAVSRAYIVAEAPSRLLAMRFDELQQLAEQHADLQAGTRRFLERLLLAKADREYELLGLDAEARYAAFRQRYPDLEARVAARHVASYLGITPVHLSRLRRRRRTGPVP